jgi:hypothetical protein
VEHDHQQLGAPLNITCIRFVAELAASAIPGGIELATLAFEDRKRRRERTTQRREQSRSSVELRKTSSEFAASLLPPHTSVQSGFDLVGNHNDITSTDDTLAAASGNPISAGGVLSDNATSNTTRASFLPR